MEAIEKQALKERIGRLTAEFEHEVQNIDASDDFAKGVKLAMRTINAKLESLRQFTDALTVEVAEDYVASTLTARAAERKKKSASTYKHEQVKSEPTIKKGRKR